MTKILAGLNRNKNMECSFLGSHRWRHLPMQNLFFGLPWLATCSDNTDPVKSVEFHIKNISKYLNMAPHLNLELDERNLSVCAAKLLEIVRPSWSMNDVRFKMFTEGISNILVGCYTDENTKDVVLIRIYGNDTQLFIDRKAELKNILILNKAGFAPPLYATFNNGLCYSYIPGVVFDVDSVRDAKLGRLVANNFAKLHSLNIPNEVQHEPLLFPTLRKMYSLVPLSYADADKSKWLLQHVPSKEIMLNEMLLLENHLVNLGSPVVFCHNDALLNNIIHNKENDQVWFIDYEYAGFNYQAYDIGNHFCEFAGLDKDEHWRYPDKEFQLKWLKSYLQLWFQHEGKNPEEVTEVDIERLYVQVNKFALASYLLWGIWAIVQSHHSKIDFDFIGFGIGRLQQYFKRKDEFLSLKL